MQDPPRSLLAPSRPIWEANAAWWAEQIGEGNTFQRTIINLPTDALLAIQPRERLLDVACSNGVYARRVAGLGVLVTAMTPRHDTLGLPLFW